MTKYEFLKAVAAGEMTEEVIAKAGEMVIAYEAESEKRRAKAAEKRAEKLASEKGLEDAVLEMLGAEPKTASDIKEAVEGIESPQKATSVVKRLVEAELVGVTEVKGKSGKVKGYIKLQYTYYVYVKTRVLPVFFLLFIIYL